MPVKYLFQGEGRVRKDTRRETGQGRQGDRERQEKQGYKMSKGGLGDRRTQGREGDRGDMVNLQGILTENALLKELEIRYTEQQYWVSNITRLYNNLHLH